MDQGKFRLDLFYRLNVFPIRVPPLRERKEDITGLLNHFLHQMADDYGRPMHFAPAALDELIRYDWPGNVREMQNLIERLVILSETERIEPDFIRSHLKPGSAPSREGVSTDELPNRPLSLKEFERNEVVAALERNGWLQYRAAEALGLTARQMGYRVKKYGLESLIAEGRARLRRMKELRK